MDAVLNRRRVLILGAGGLPVLAQQPNDSDRIWKEYLQWLERESPRSFLGLIDYRQTLAARGLPEPQVERYMAVISERAITGHEAMRIWFNSVYSRQAGFFTESPNAFLADAVRALRPGTALDVSMGQGRNCVFLAQLGWDVTGFDVSDEGLAIAQRNAEKAGVKIRTELAGYEEFDFGVRRWDLIAMIYAFVPLGDPSFARKVTASLAPQGRIVIETRLRTERHAQGKLAGLMGIVGPGELKTAFQHLDLLRYEEVDAEPDFGSGSAPLVRMIARLAERHM